MSINKRAIISGALGATASFIAKLALSPESPVPSTVDTFCIDSITTFQNNAGDDLLCDFTWVCPYVSLITRGLCLLCMVGVNVLMVSSFLDGMDESGSVVGTALSTAANFSLSALYGVLFFEEYVPMSWYFGATLIAFGMWILSSVTLSKETGSESLPEDVNMMDESVAASEETSAEVTPKPAKRGRSRSSSRKSMSPKAAITTANYGKESKKQSKPRGRRSVSKDEKKESKESSSSGIKTPNASDVLGGRGANINRHEGNIKFREEAGKLKSKYRESSRQEKALVREELVNRVKECGGRFLEKYDDDLWYEMNDTDAKAKAARVLVLRG